MINEQLMEKVGKDLESIVAGDRKSQGDPGPGKAGRRDGENDPL